MQWPLRWFMERQFRPLDENHCVEPLRACTPDGVLIEPTVTIIRPAPHQPHVPAA